MNAMNEMGKIDGGNEVAEKVSKHKKWKKRNKARLR